MAARDADNTRSADPALLKARPFGGYYQRPAAHEPSALTEVGPGTAGGEYLRRYWHPLLMSSELSDLPKAVRLLGEDLVLFRDGSGRIGLLHKHCLHRGASLEFGIPQKHGIMCCYHGWQFDVDGRILSLGAEPSSSRIGATFAQGAYPVKEYRGLIFAYMGSPEAMPAFPEYDSFIHPGGNTLYPFQITLPCNWLQIVDNACDPIHNLYLHAIVSGQQFSPAFSVPPALDFVETPLGFLSMATRRIKDSVFIRASDIIMPNVAQFANSTQQGGEDYLNIAAYVTRWAVPVDDRNSFYTGFIHVNDRTRPGMVVDPSEIGFEKLGLIGQTSERPYEERQREPGDYDALVGQGAIVNHKNEHLGTTDKGVMMFRRMLARAQEAVRIGETPKIPKVYGNEIVRTYNYDMIFKLPSRSNFGDTQSMTAFGRKASQIIIEGDRLPPLEREAAAAARIRGVLAQELSA